MASEMKHADGQTNMAFSLSVRFMHFWAKKSKNCNVFHLVPQIIRGSII